MYNTIALQLETSEEDGDICNPEPKKEGTGKKEEKDEEESDKSISNEEGLGFTEDKHYAYRWVPTGQWEYGGDPAYKGPASQSQACCRRGTAYTPPGWLRHYLYVR